MRTLTLVILSHIRWKNGGDFSAVTGRISQARIQSEALPQLLKVYSTKTFSAVTPVLDSLFQSHRYFFSLPQIRNRRVYPLSTSVAVLFTDNHLYTC